MKVNRYKLKEGVTKEDLLSLEAREGGTWIDKKSKLFLSKCFTMKNQNMEFEVSVAIAFRENIADWDDFQNILVLDEDFGQPYTPFYNHRLDDVTDWSVLVWLIGKYNEYLDSLPILERIVE